MVDDESLMLSVLGSVCSKLNIKKVYKASSAKQAIDFHNSEDIDVTFLDIEMPVKNGIEALKEIK